MNKTFALPKLDKFRFYRPSLSHFFKDLTSDTLAKYAPEIQLYVFSKIINAPLGTIRLPKGLIEYINILSNDEISHLNQPKSTRSAPLSPVDVTRFRYYSADFKK